ncbi:hypothetical protein MMC34_006405 [Xylographa carneopallida]|nr:hypothetical protein [Xylographa carneopallida]
MLDSFDVDADMERTRSSSTLVSEALTFYSVPTSSPTKEPDVFRKMDPVLGQNQSTDSGFAESIREEADIASTVPSAGVRHLEHSTGSGNHPLKDDPLCWSSSDAQRAPLPHCETLRTTRDSSLNASVPCTTMTPKVASRRASAAQAAAITDHKARQSSRRSSFKHAPPSVAASTPRSIRTVRTRRTLSSGATFDDPYLTYHRARQMFQSFGSTLGSQSAPNHEHQEPLIGAPIGPFHVTRTHDRDGTPNISNVCCSKSGREGTISTPTPCTIIDWTAPATRRREYEKIDRSSRGMRGLWRKVTPRWCRSSSRTGFFDGDEDDARSVRRYRVDISEEPDGEKEEGFHVRERELRPPLFRSKTTWSCFGFGGGKKTKTS